MLPLFLSSFAKFLYEEVITTTSKPRRYSVRPGPQDPTAIQVTARPGAKDGEGGQVTSYLSPSPSFAVIQNANRGPCTALCASPPSHSASSPPSPLRQGASASPTSSATTPRSTDLPQVCSRRSSPGPVQWALCRLPQRQG